MELVDVPDSKSGFRKEVGVRFPPPAPKTQLAAPASSRRRARLFFCGVAESAR